VRAYSCGIGPAGFWQVKRDASRFLPQSQDCREMINGIRATRPGFGVAGKPQLQSQVLIL
jgi:hypothetical protein